MQILVPVVVIVPVVMPVIMAVMIAVIVAVVMAVMIAVIVVLFVVLFVALVVAMKIVLPPVMVIPVSTFSATREAAAVAVVRIIAAIHPAMKITGAAEPWTRAKKFAALEPFRTVIAKWSAVVWRVIEIAIRANRRGSDLNPKAHLSARTGRG